MIGWSRLLRPRVMIGVVLGLLLLGGAGAAWRVWRERRAPLRILLITAQEDPSVSGLASGEARAVGMLVREQLEYLGRCSVTSTAQVPVDLDFLRGDPRTCLVQLEPRRAGNDLSLSYRVAQARDLRPGLPIPWRAHALAAQPPAQAVGAFLQDLRGGGPFDLRAFVPADPGLFWMLMRGSSLRLQAQHLEVAEDLARQVVQRDAGCATAWMLLGTLRYFATLTHPDQFRSERADTEAHFQRALVLAPHHPHAVMILALLKSDAGNHREALDLLVAARRERPHNLSLLTGISYAAQGAGLIPLARRAVDLQDQMAFKPLAPKGVDVLRLYTGELDRFEASLQEQPDHRQTIGGVLAYYRGYLALLRQNRALAHQEFHQAAELASVYPHIQRLSRIYDLILEGRTPEALREARSFDEERVGMQEPDGEVSLRLAEAYALMGDRGHAMELCTRAFARGFGFTEWFETSPVLASLRDLPRWKLLIQHMKERQGLLEERFPLRVLDA